METNEVDTIWTHPSLTDEDYRELQEIKLRKGLYSELFGRKDFRSYLRNQIRAFYRDVKDWLKTGKTVDKPQVTGGTDEELAVTIAGRNLREFLPDAANYGFLGVAVTLPSDSWAPPLTELSSPRFNLMNKKIELVTEIQRGAEGRRTADLPNASLSVLHEIGHARDESRNHRLIPVLKASTRARLYPGSVEISEVVRILPYAVERKDLDVETLRKEVTRRIKSNVEGVFRQQGEGAISPVLTLWGENPVQFQNDLTQDLVKEVWGIYQEAIQVARQGHLEEAVRLATDRLKEQQNLYNDEAQKLEHEKTAKCERQAWAEALLLARRLIKENGAKLWQGGVKELFFEIDRCINAHGKEGRLGVKRPDSRIRLSLQ